MSSANPTHDRSMAGKVVVITGATSGIGQTAAEALASLGARIVQVARSRPRAGQALQRLRQRAPGLNHTVHYADLSSVEETKRVAEEIGLAEPRTDVLINNAGAIFSTRQVTPEGFERTFALNHMSYFVLTHCLLPRLLASSPARIVNTASDAHESGSLRFDDLQSEQAYRGSFGTLLRYGGPGFRVYGTSKLCNILFTRELARRLAGTGVTANSVHPGFVGTRFGDESGGLMSFSLRIAKRFALPLDRGAETLIYLASSPDVSGVTGQYFHQSHIAAASAAAQDAKAAARLWSESARLANLPD